jgi:proteic killer suppression protein
MVRTKGLPMPQPAPIVRQTTGRTRPLSSGGALISGWHGTTLARHNAQRYYLVMIRTYHDRDTERLASRQRVKKWSPELSKAALRKLRMLDAAEELSDLRVPPGNRLERLKGDRAGQYSIRINDQWRICFRFEGGNAYDVEIVDDH